MGQSCCTRSQSDQALESLTHKADSMQEVLNNIYMGSAVAAKNLDLLKSNGITHIIAIGWNLDKYFEGQFEYLLINKVEDGPECNILNYFQISHQFMDNCLNQSPPGKLFVHCHKGLSRSATIVIGYEMKRRKSDYHTVLSKIRQSRSFIMPNIGFQAQLHEFERMNYSLDQTKYTNFNSIQFIKDRLPKMLSAIKRNYEAYSTDPDEVDEDELFEVTLYTHQVHKLRQKDKLTEGDIKILKDSIQSLRQIQVEFVDNAASLRRFDIMFKDKEPEKDTFKVENGKYNHVESISATQEITVDDPSPTTNAERGDAEAQTVTVEMKETSDEVAADE